MSTTELQSELADASQVIAALTAKLERANERIARLEKALDFVVPVCSCLVHPKKHQHSLGEPCPVERIIKEAKEPKP